MQKKNFLTWPRARTTKKLRNNLQFWPGVDELLLSFKFGQEKAIEIVVGEGGR